MRNKEMLKKMSVKCVSAIMIAAMAMSPVAASVAFPVTVYAQIVEVDGKTVNDAEGVTNVTSEHTVDVNQGSVTTNEGEIVSNEADVSQNYGIIDTNEESGDVDLNGSSGRIEINNGSVDINQGEVGLGEYDAEAYKYYVIEDTGNYGNIESNMGTVYFNGEDDEGHKGVITTNSGTVAVNGDGGEITTNAAGGKVYENDGYINANRGNVKVNKESIGTNYNRVGDNYGIIEKAQSGIIDGNNGNVMTNYAKIDDNFTHGVIETNGIDGIINHNYGKVYNNANQIIINEGWVGTVNQYGIVTGNTGEVVNNTENGIVLNLAGGVVEKNNGTVYNYGGTVLDKGTGTEYFSVKVSNSNSVSTASGLTQAYNQDWLGQTGTAVSTATITISPASGYRITNVSGFGDNVSAIKNDDGTWTLTISSGINTSIDVASALINNPTNPSDPFDPTKIKIEVEPDNSNQENPPGQNQNPAAPGVTIPVIDTSAATLAAATWDGTAIKIGDTAVTVTALAVQDCAAITSTTATQAELALVYENIFINAIAANNGSVAGARDEALKVVTAFAGYLPEDIPVNYTMAQVATYKVTYMNAFLKAIADGKTLKKARSAGRSAANTAVMNLIFMRLNEGNPVLSIENAIAE